MQATCYGNALAAYAQSGQLAESHWLAPEPVDQRLLFQGNTVLRGQEPHVGELPELAPPVEAMAIR